MNLGNIMLSAVSQEWNDSFSYTCGLNNVRIIRADTTKEVSGNEEVLGKGHNILIRQKEYFIV